MDVAVGNELLGRVIIRSVGSSIAMAGSFEQRLPIETPCAAIMDRAPVTVPLQTGIKVIDSLIPVGRGQAASLFWRPPDRKTAPIDTILNQPGQNVLCRLLCHRQRGVSCRKGHCDPREKVRWITPSSS